MHIALLTSRVLLALLFGVAGAAKLADRTGARRAIVEFGVPRKLAGALTVALPVAEVMASVLLLPVASAWVGALVALLLLLSFILAIIFNLARGRAPECNCYGQVHSTPIGWAAVGPSVVLVAVAALIVAGGRKAGGSGSVAWRGVSAR